MQTGGPLGITVARPADRADPVLPGLRFDYYLSMPASNRALACLIALAFMLSACAPLSTASTQPATRASGGQGTASSASDPSPAGEAGPSAASRSGLDAHLMYELLLGEFSFVEGRSQTGSAFVLRAARRTGEDALYQRATEMAIQSRAGTVALEAVRAWRQAHPDSLAAQRYELQVLMALGRVLDTAEPLRSMVATLPASEQEGFILALPALFQRSSQPAEASQAVEQALDQVLQGRPPNLAAVAWTTIGRMRLANDDAAGALAAATLGQDADPGSRWPAILALQLLTSAGEERAEALVRHHLARPDATPEVGTAYARALLELDRPGDAMQQIEHLTRPGAEHPEALLLKGLVLVDQRRDEAAEQTLLRYLELTEATEDSEQVETPDHEPGRGQAYLNLARLAEQQGRDLQAEQWLERVELPEQLLAARIRQARLMARRSGVEPARSLILTAPERGPEDEQLKLLAEAELLRQHGQPQLSWDLLSAALDEAPDDERLLYDTAMAAEALDRVGDMERLLRRLIELSPEAAHAYNALGYTLADRGLRLAEARELILRAVELSPTDAYIQDSLGWVEFRLGHHARARDILQAAFDKRPDAEIAAHLGEVLWTLGQHAAARQAWSEGLRLDARNQTLQDTMKRLQGQP